MHIYSYISAILIFILIPILFILLLQAIYDQNVRQIYIFGTWIILTLAVSLALLARDFTEGL